MINENTTIASLLKHDPAALDAIVSLSTRFNLLKNPMMRKLMAGRTTIATATKIGGVSLQSFFEKLAPLGFRVEAPAKPSPARSTAKPSFISSLKEGQLIELDVRPFLSSGKDPLRTIQDIIIKLKAGQVLKIINSFEPSPLIDLYSKKGFETYVETVNERLVFTYLFRTNTGVTEVVPTVPAETGNWHNFLSRFAGKIQSIDVRQLEMPKPMLTILEALERLPEGYALLVLHKRVPVFLLPQLEERQFAYQLKNAAGEEVQMLIYRM